MSAPAAPPSTIPASFVRRAEKSVDKVIATVNIAAAKK
jgi:hypothetical protein